MRQIFWAQPTIIILLNSRLVTTMQLFGWIIWLRWILYSSKGRVNSSEYLRALSASLVCQAYTGSWAPWSHPAWTSCRAAPAPGPGRARHGCYQRGPRSHTAGCSGCCQTQTCNKLNLSLNLFEQLPRAQIRSKFKNFFDFHEANDKTIVLSTENVQKSHLGTKLWLFEKKLWQKYFFLG